MTGLSSCASASGLPALVSRYPFIATRVFEKRLGIEFSCGSVQDPVGNTQFHSLEHWEDQIQNIIQTDLVYEAFYLLNSRPVAQAYTEERYADLSAAISYGIKNFL